MRSLDLTEQTFGMLTGVRYLYSDARGRRIWLFDCECGNETEAAASHVSSGHGKQHCGCLTHELRSEGRKEHGFSNHPRYRVWYKAIQRCENPNDPDYLDYGGRGIEFCERWHDFPTYVADLETLGPKPDNTSLDRIDVNGNYEPGNVRWATPLEQRHNRRDSGGKRRGLFMTQAEWEKLTPLVEAQADPVLVHLAARMRAGERRTRAKFS